MTTRGRLPVTWEAGWLLDLPPGDGPHPVVLALHGYRDDGECLRARLPSLHDAPYAVLYPDGPFPVEVREDDGGRVGYAWYQYTGDQAAFLHALEFVGAHVARLLDHVASRHPIDPRRVVALGYSQGGYAASVMALRDPGRFRGLVAMATRIKVEAIDDLAAARDLPVLVVHGERDGAIAAARQLEMVEELRRHGIAVDVQLHPGGHGLKPELSGAVDRFVRGVFRVGDV